MGGGSLLKASMSKIKYKKGIIALKHYHPLTHVPLDSVVILYVTRANLVFFQSQLIQSVCTFPSSQKTKTYCSKNGERGGEGE